MPRPARTVQRGLLHIGVCTLLSVLPLAGRAQQDLDRAARWREDLRVFAETFAASQKDFAKLYPRPAFDATLARLSRQADTLPDTAITLDLMRLVASARVAHTMVQWPGPELGFTRLPLSVRWYADGLAVMAASPEMRPALGARVLRIGNRTPDELLADLAPYISYEKPAWLKAMSAVALTMAPDLQRAGVVSAEGRVRLTLQKPDGAPFDLEVPVTPAAPPAKMLSVFDEPGAHAPLARTQPARIYWHQYLPERRALYIQYRQCRDDPAHPFADFTREVLDVVDTRDVERVILDLRSNGGGNSVVLNPLTDGLRARPTLRSRIFVLIGPDTFSSAMLAAFDFRRQLGATLVGEPIGESMNSYGEVRTFTLPHSNLRVQYSTKYFALGDDSVLEPQIRAAATLADTLAGRDPALEAALTAPVRSR